MHHVPTGNEIPPAPVQTRKHGKFRIRQCDEGGKLADQRAVCLGGDAIPRGNGNSWCRQ
jgi:hypothetical protein